MNVHFIQDEEHVGMYYIKTEEACNQDKMVMVPEQQNEINI